MTTSQTYLVAGMTCEHCVRAVTAEVSALAGVTDVSVELNPDGASNVAVTSDAPLPESAVVAAIDEAGYELTKRHE